MFECSTYNDLLRDHVNATVINCPIPLTNLNCGNANPEIQTTRTHIWPRDANSNAKRANPDKVNTKFTAKLDTDGFSEKAKRRSLQEHVFIKQISWKTAQNWQKSTNNGSRFDFNIYLMTKTIKMEYDHGFTENDIYLWRPNWSEAPKIKFEFESGLIIGEYLNFTSEFKSWTDQNQGIPPSSGLFFGLSYLQTNFDLMILLVNSLWFI